MRTVGHLWAAMLLVFGFAGAACSRHGARAPRVMIVGDSIAAGPGCYKKYLVEKLRESGRTHYEFVGEYEDACGGGVRHSAVSCARTTDYAQPSFTLPRCFEDERFPGMAALVEEHRPDIVLLQLGVNDVWDGTASVPAILQNYEKLVAQARARNPEVTVVVAQIQKIATDDCSNPRSTAKAEELVTAVPAWARSVSTQRSPVLVADLWTNSDPRDGDDCVHPNDAGARRMALNWFRALEKVLR